MTFCALSSAKGMDIKMNGISDSMGGNADQRVNHMLHADALTNELLTVDTV